MSPMSHFLRLLLLLPLMFILMVVWYVPSHLNRYSRPWSSIQFDRVLSNTNQTPPNFKYCYQVSHSTVVFLHLNYHSSKWHPIEACAFKTAAVMNPASGVCVLVARPMDSDVMLDRLSNLEIAPLDTHLLFDGTTLWDWYKNRILVKKWGASFVMWELSDALRYAYLYKYGGKYMDTDTWTLRSLDELWNVAGWESEHTVANGVLFFEKGHPLMKAAVQNLIKFYSPNNWGSVGPTMITALHKTGKYGPYSILNSTAFFPVHWYESDILFDPNEKEKIKMLINDSYTLHLSHFSTQKYWESENRVPADSFVGQFLTDVCYSV